MRDGCNCVSIEEIVQGKKSPRKMVGGKSKERMNEGIRGVEMTLKQSKRKKDHLEKKGKNCEN